MEAAGAGRTEEPPQKQQRTQDSTEVAHEAGDKAAVDTTAPDDNAALQARSRPSRLPQPPRFSVGFLFALAWAIFHV